jgi:hypothetical protein
MIVSGNTIAYFSSQHLPLYGGVRIDAEIGRERRVDLLQVGVLAGDPSEEVLYVARLAVLRRCLDDQLGTLARDQVVVELLKPDR